MPSTDQPITLPAEVVQEVAQKLSDLRHNINNHLSLVIASIEMIRRKPEVASRMIDTIADQPGKITEEVSRFSDSLEAALGIVRER